MSKEEALSNQFNGKYTRVTYDSDFKGIAPTTFDVTKRQEFETNSLEIMVDTIKFHEGEIKDGVNGIMMEDAILAVLTRLNYLQNSEFACMENQEIILYLEQSLATFERRKKRREREGLEGTHQVGGEI